MKTKRRLQRGSTPRHGGLVGAQAVEEVEVLDLPHTLLVQLLAIRRLVPRRARISSS